jgi:hypothetical protein
MGKSRSGDQKPKATSHGTTKRQSVVYHVLSKDPVYHVLSKCHVPGAVEL